MRSITLILFLLISLAGNAQYYYQDIVTNRNNQQQFIQMKKQKVASVKVTSREGNGEPTEGFLLEQIFSSSYTQLRTVSRLAGSYATTLTNYYNQHGYLYRMVDSSEQSVIVYDYQYNDSGALVRLSSTSRAVNEKARFTESHEWRYGQKGEPLQMLRTRDGDTLEVQFKHDEKGNVAEEEHYRKGIPVNKVYYYYDDGGRLTDVVRYQEKLGRLIPDYTFNYDESGRITEMMVVQNSGRNYLTWRYIYDPTGLKSRESCYDRQKKLLGSMEYSYTTRK